MIGNTSMHQAQAAPLNRESSIDAASGSHRKHRSNNAPFVRFKKRLPVSEALNSVGPLKRISARRTRVQVWGNARRTVFEGHGEIKAPVKQTVVPSATTITLYTGLNCILLDQAAIAIANNDKLPSSLRYKGTDFEGYHEADVFGGRSYLTGSRRTYAGGELVPNLMLYPPSPGMKISSSSVITDKPVELKQLLKEHAGEDCHWAACTIVRP